MSPDDSVQHVARLFTTDPEFTEDGVYAAMVTANVPDREADVAYKFTQAAWGRLLLDGMGIKFADDYYCLDGNGEVVDSGKLSAEPHFIAATRLARRHSTQAGFKRLAAMSADFHAVNQALNAGSRPENLLSAPLVLFLEPPSEAGMAKARRFMTDLLSPPEPSAPDVTQSRPSGVSMCLGVRKKLGDGSSEIPVDADGNGHPGSGGMSVYSSLRVMPARMVPKRLQALIAGAAGNNGTSVWALGDGPFVSGQLAERLTLRIDPDDSQHGFVEPDVIMSWSEYQEALASTQSSWVVDEG
jgi:hypothetical protein